MIGPNMDLMPLFKAYVKTAQLQTLPVPDKSRILKKHGTNNGTYDFLHEPEKIHEQVSFLTQPL